jgi:hypothetical protein
MNKKTHSRTWATRVAGVVVAMLVAASGSAFAGTTQADTWAATGAQGDVSVSGLGTPSATATFEENFGIGAGVTLEPQASAATFVGDYDAAGASDVSFTLSGTAALPATACVILLSGSGNTWIARGLALGDNTISFDEGTGGWILAYDWGQAADFGADLADVVMIGVRLQRNTSEAGQQSFTISSLAVTSDREIGPASLSLADALEARFGVRTIEEVPYGDEDLDGMSDLDEFLAEFDHDYFAENLFRAEVLDDAAGLRIRYACVSGFTYTVNRAATVDGLSAGTLVDTKAAAETGFDYVIDTNPGNGPNFYNVIEE